MNLNTTGLVETMTRLGGGRGYSQSEEARYGVEHLWRKRQEDGKLKAS
jgi:hypothetical protein